VISDSTKYSNISGFALIIVLWTLVLIGAIGIYLIANARAETSIAHNVRAAASAEALADTGIARAVFNQTDPTLPDRWELDGTVHRLPTPSGEIDLRLQDETKKINPNHASDALLAALFEISGVDRTHARRLGAAIADWVGPDVAPRELGAKLAQYQAAGRNYGPPNAPIESLDELLLVLGMTPGILASVRPYLTIYTQSGEPNGKNAPLTVQRALALAEQMPDENTDQTGPQPSTAGSATAKAAGEQDERLIAVESSGRSLDGGTFVRCAVLRLEPDNGKGYAVLDWRRGGLDE
jgi:general secretion pathway protein K